MKPRLGMAATLVSRCAPEQQRVPVDNVDNVGCLRDPSKRCIVATTTRLERFMPAKDIGLAVLVQVIWGVGFTLMKPTMSAFPPLLFIALVYAVIALAATPLAPKSRTPFVWMML